jgi:hypothetical protein
LAFKKELFLSNDNNQYNALTHAIWYKPKNVLERYVVILPINCRLNREINHYHNCHQISIIPTKKCGHFKIRWFSRIWMVSNGFDILYTDEEENEKSDHKFNYQWSKEYVGDKIFYLKQGDNYVARKEKVNYVKLEKNRDLALIFCEVKPNYFCNFFGEHN